MALLVDDDEPLPLDEPDDEELVDDDESELLLSDEDEELDDDEDEDDLPFPERESVL